MKTQELINLGESVIMPTYARFPIAFDHGHGCTLTDVDGKDYLDFVGGIAVNSLGYNDPGLVKTISEQAAKIMHVSNLYYTKPQIKAAQLLVDHSGLDKVFFCNSGAEGNEAAMKLARVYAKKFKSEEAVEIIAMDHSFHGRTYAAITATGQPKYQANLSPLMPEITHVPFNDFDALKAAVSKKTCAILLEPIQGEGGIHPADHAYLKAVRHLCDQENIVLIFDEVQCGIGRTGTFFAYQQYDLKPDVVCFAKGVAGGVPMGGIVATEKVCQVFTPGTHASTFGGNPLAAAAACYVLSKVTKADFLKEVSEKGKYLMDGLRQLKEKHPVITDVRGMGLMCGIELSIPASELVAKAIDAGLLLVGAGANIVRFVPPLVVSREEIDKCLLIIDKIL